MAEPALAQLLAGLARTAAPPEAVSDRELLERFRDRSDEGAFAALLRRHGAMVLGVARRVVGSAAADAEDVCQSVFLTLARRAAAIRQADSLASWLHGVALRQAWKFRAASARRRAAESRAATATPRSEDVTWREALAVLDEELARLPACYRAPLVLCYLEGRTQDEAARRLGWTLSTCRGRLERGRRKLRERLARRGLELGTVLGGAALAASAGPALAGPLVRVIARAAVLTLGSAVQAGALPVTALAAGWARWRWPLAALLLVGLTALCATPSTDPPPAQPAADIPPAPADRSGESLPPGAIARLGSDRLRVGDMVQSVAFTPDGRTVVASNRREVRTFETATGRPLRRFDLPTDGYREDLSVTPDGRIACLRGRKTLTYHLLDPATGRELRRLDIAQPAYSDSVAFTRAGDRFAVAGEGQTVRIYDAVTGAETAHFPFTGPRVWRQEFSPDGRLLALTDGDTLRVHDTATGKVTAELRREGVTFWFVIFSPDGRSLASIEEQPGERRGHVIRLWDLAAGTTIRTFTDSPSSIHDLTFSPDGRQLAAGSISSNVILWETATGREVRRLRGCSGVLRMAFTPDGSTLAAANNQGAVTLWDLGPGTSLPQSADPVETVRDLRFTPDGQRIFGSAETILEWDSGSGATVHRFPTVGTGSVWLALSPDRRLIAAAELAGPIGLYDATTGTLIRALQGHDRPCWRVVFSPDGRALFSASGDRTVRAWDVATGRELHRMTGYTTNVEVLAVSPDGRHLAAASTGGSAQGDFAVRLYDAATGRDLRRFMPEHGSVFAIVFSPDSRWMVTVGGEPGRPDDRGAVQLWEVATGRMVRSFAGHTEKVLCAALSGDGRTLATGAVDNTARLWEVATGLERARITAHREMIHAIAFSPDGRRLASASTDAPVYVWNVDALAGVARSPLTADDLDRCWADLAAADGAAAFRAVRRLAGSPERALPLLRGKLKPAAGVEAEQVRKLARDLDSPRFADRQRATAELGRIAADAEAILRRERDAAGSLEVRQRLDRLLKGIDTDPEVLRAVRAVEAVGAMAGPESARFLEDLAGGAADARLTREAAAARVTRGAAPP